jgi:hypothetical protein
MSRIRAGEGVGVFERRMSNVVVIGHPQKELLHVAASVDVTKQNAFSFAFSF